MLLYCVFCTSDNKPILNLNLNLNSKNIYSVSSAVQCNVSSARNVSGCRNRFSPCLVDCCPVTVCRLHSFNSMWGMVSNWLMSPIVCWADLTTDWGIPKLHMILGRSQCIVGSHDQCDSLPFFVGHCQFLLQLHNKEQSTESGAISVI